MLQKSSDVHHMFSSLNAGSEALDNKRVSTVECYFLSLKVTLRQKTKTGTGTQLWCPQHRLRTADMLKSVSTVYAQKRKCDGEEFPKHQYLRLQCSKSLFQYPTPNYTTTQCKDPFKLHNARCGTTSNSKAFTDKHQYISNITFFLHCLKIATPATKPVERIRGGLDNVCQRHD